MASVMQESIIIVHHSLSLAVNMRARARVYVCVCVRGKNIRPRKFIKTSFLSHKALWFRDWAQGRSKSAVCALLTPPLD
jgi:hypothetical protein